ncbi:hypothetical protein GUITHDRAFT_122434 [Guillardia theta CCMP2712]|uniref:Uncharacterized protein n=1 Tax=Guillardia theta (strain CCMP2712) TaxID=905079 RepID=L1I686_GUITC|nr:hypothetical protein GUITHDRAFT_122434 [Guillardia theta CCMP2712]EKX31365.1 hypothetical protein GUITHDRAFT_122434 [Guillardia theta CCMP2712]|eukprot:XP_005818345.1 hypothetical protein GUITHDRAFT_122434 [Guillardia theta CCMP2712]
MDKLQAENDELRRKLESATLMISAENKSNRDANQKIADLKRQIVDLEIETLSLSRTKNHLSEEITLNLFQLHTVKMEKRNLEIHLKPSQILDLQKTSLHYRKLYEESQQSVDRLRKAMDAKNKERK